MNDVYKISEDQYNDLHEQRFTYLMTWDIN